MGVPELEQQISAQGLKVKELKTSKADADTIKAEVAVLLKLKQEITALDPNHPQAIVDKKKKKEKAKAPQGPSKKELRILAKQKKAAEDAAKAKEAEAASADVFGEPGVCMSASMTARRWTSVGAVGPHLIGSDVWVRARVHAVRAKGNLAFVVLRQGCFTVQGVASAPAIPKAMVALWKLQ